MIEKRRLFKEFLKTPSLNNLRSLNSHGKRTKKKIREIRKFSFRDFCSTIDINFDSGKMWRTLKAFRTGRTPGSGALSADAKNRASGAMEELCRPNLLNSARTREETSLFDYVPVTRIYPFARTWVCTLVRPRLEMRSRLNYAMRGL